MSTVLWGGRRGDVVYGGREWRRHNIVIDPAVTRLTLAHSGYFDVGTVMEVHALVEGPLAREGAWREHRVANWLRVVGIEGSDVGVVGHP